MSGVEALLVRHGRSTANLRGIWQGRLDYGLSREGREQAWRTGRSLAGEEVSRIYSSPLARAAESARIIAGEIGYPASEIEHLQDLTERGGGVLEGKTWREFEARRPEQARRFFELADEARWEYLGAESTASALSRARRSLESVRSRHAPGETVILVSHGGLLGSFFLDEFGPEIPGEESALGNGSITRLFLTGDGPRAAGLGDTSHLSG
ncbi:MAG: histidine phosphatase family protein [Rubrobacter sp.]|nr:histidine phosphatase family protein [Rubrobacter sp.]